jgi:hypothetical protein
MCKSALHAVFGLWVCALTAPPAVAFEDNFEIAANVQGRSVVAATVASDYVACAAAIGMPAQFVLEAKSRALWLVSESRETRAEISDKAFQEWIAVREAMSEQQVAHKKRALNDEHINEVLRSRLKEASAGELRTHPIGRPTVEGGKAAQHIDQLVPLEQSLEATQARVSALGKGGEYIPQVFRCFIKSDDVPFVARLAKKGSPPVPFTKRPLAAPAVWRRFRTVPLWQMFVSAPALVESLSASK